MSDLRNGFDVNHRIEVRPKQDGMPLGDILKVVAFFFVLYVLSQLFQ